MDTLLMPRVFLLLFLPAPLLLPHSPRIAPHSQAVKGSHAIAIMTEWDAFKTYDYEKMYQSMAKPAFVFDGRLILDHKKLLDIGFIVYAIGKPYGVKYKNMDDLRFE